MTVTDTIPVAFVESPN